eukprot:6174588-Pleurochrysis_carterae.AAC.3
MTIGVGPCLDNTNASSLPLPFSRESPRLFRARLAGKSLAVSMCAAGTTADAQVASSLRARNMAR